MERKIPLDRQNHGNLKTFSAALNPGLFTFLAICTFTSTLFFYSSVYSIHHDLGGGALSGRLAITLGESFGDYSIYFPPAEKFWFSAAALLSNFSGLPLDLTVIAMTNIMVLFGAGLAYYIRRTTVGTSPSFLFVSLSILILLPILFKNIFGLREHLVVVGLWPYLVLRYSDPNGNLVGTRLRILVGLWMGFTLLFKYLYSLVVLLVEIADAIAKRQPVLLFRIENIIAGGIVFVYLFTWLGTDPAQREVIGMMFSAIDANLMDRNENLLKVAEYIIPGILLLIVSWFSGVPKRSIGLATAVVIATIIAAWTQERWYTHHVFPISMAYIFWWWIAAQRFRWPVTLAVALVTLFPVALQFLSAQVYQKQSSELAQALENEGLSVQNKRVAILTMHPSPYNQFLASQDAQRWNPMVNIAYVAAELKPFDKKDSIGKPPPIKLDNPGRRVLHERMLQMWEDQPPDVLILDRTHRWPLRYVEVDWVHAFSEDSRFNTILENYRVATDYDGDQIRFSYYVRTN